MKTKILNFTSHMDEQDLAYAARLIRSGKLVAFPTETVYGLGADAFHEKAVAEIFKVKGRPQDNPLIAHLSDLHELDKIAINIPNTAYTILNAFAPGPLTVILQKSDLIPDVVSAGLKTVGIRFPANLAARRLIKAAQVPIVAPSANLSGKPSPTKAWHVYEDLAGKIPCIIDGGACQFGLESTILDLSNEEPEILRPGFISAEDIRRKTGITVKDYHKPQTAVEKPKAPGQKYKHYSPKAKVIILDERSDLQKRLEHLENGLSELIGKMDKKAYNQQLRIAFYFSEDIALQIKRQNVLPRLKTAFESGHLHFKMVTYHNETGAAEAANHLFDCFRAFDREQFDYIICTAEPLREKGLAYMNRLEKAASFRL